MYIEVRKYIGIFLNTLNIRIFLESIGAVNNKFISLILMVIEFFIVNVYHMKAINIKTPPPAYKIKFSTSKEPLLAPNLLVLFSISKSLTLCK